MIVQQKIRKKLNIQQREMHETQTLKSRANDNAKIFLLTSKSLENSKQPYKTFSRETFSFL